MNSSHHWKPTASIETLQQRAKILQEIRKFFDLAGYWEVETPLVSQESITDAYIDPLQVQQEPQETTRYLQTSPEAHMKRLLSAGADRIFQLTKSIRKHEQGQLHNTEFTMLEWYACGCDHYAQMAFVEELIRTLCLQVETAPQLTDQPFERLTYDEAFEKYLGQPVLQLSAVELKNLAVSAEENRTLQIPNSLTEHDRDGWLNLLLAELVEPNLGTDRPTFLLNYPASQAALAKVANETPPIAERFELYLNGVEICNGYHELGDPQELESRFNKQNEIRKQEQRKDHPLPTQFLEAMKAGYPESAGVALGIDRLIMWLTKKATIQEVVAFPYDRA